MSEQLSFQQVCDNVPMGIVILTGEYRIVYWNRWLEQKTGVPAAKNLRPFCREMT